MTVGKIRNDANDAWIELTGGPPDPTDTNWCHDTDTLAEDSASHCATQQSIKAYIDAQVAAAGGYTYTAYTAAPAATGYEFSATLPSNVCEIDVLFVNVSTNAANNPLSVQLGSSTGYVVTGYQGKDYITGTGKTASVAITTRAQACHEVYWDAANSYTGFINFKRAHPDQHTWIYHGRCIMVSATTYQGGIDGRVQLNGDLDRIRAVAYNGTGTFDVGGFCVRYMIGS